MRYFFLFLFFLQASLLAFDNKQIGKVFMIPCFGKKDVPVVKTLIDVYGVDNILLSIKSTSELKEVMQELSQHAPFPLFYAMDAEIGLAQRLKDEIRLPRALTLGALPTSCEELIFDLGYVIAGRGAAMGIHMNLAPVLDVNSNPNNPVIGVRSFGDDSAQVARKGVLMMQGIEAGGQMACIKHFPGHGNVAVDTHKALAVVETPAECKAVDLLPFQEAIDQGAKSVMLGHLVAPFLDPDCVSSLSDKVIRFLREEMEFSGLIITDALDMKALDFLSCEEVSARAFLAGNDILLYTDVVSAERAMRGLIALVKQENLLPDLEARTEKILRSKAQLVAPDTLLDPLKIKQAIFRNCITQIGKPIALPLCLENKTVLHLTVDGKPGLAPFRAKKHLWMSFQSQEPPQEEVILVLHEGITGRVSQEIASYLQDFEGTVVLFCSPYALKWCNASAQTLFIGYEDDPCAHSAVADVFAGVEKPRGKLPIRYELVGRSF